jgi:hypothetical protein
MMATMEPMKPALWVFREVIVLRMEHFSTLAVLAFGGVRQKTMLLVPLTTTLHRATV